MNSKPVSRSLELVCISDVHLGTYGSKAEDLLSYLKSIQPKTLILNGDILDIWQFKKSYFPASHMKVLKQVFSMLAKGTKVYYITGNHDEMLRKFNGFRLGDFEVVNHLTLELNKKKVWFFHGDIFDIVIQNSRWIARLGAIGYDTLIRLNTLVNLVSNLLGKGPVQLSKRIKDNVKKSKKYINEFENSAALQGLKRGVDYIVCGHIHKPEMRQITAADQKIWYLNSGDWVENYTALEFNEGKWTLYQHDFNRKNQSEIHPNSEAELDIVDMDNKKIFNLLIDEIYAQSVS